MLRNNSWRHNGRAGKLCYGFDGTRADLSELTVTWGSSWCRSSAVGVREHVSGISCCGSKAVDGSGTFEFCQCFRADSRVFKTAGEVRRTRGALQMLGNPAEGRCFPYFRC